MLNVFLATELQLDLVPGLSCYSQQAPFCLTPVYADSDSGVLMGSWAASGWSQWPERLNKCVAGWNFKPPPPQSSGQGERSSVTSGPWFDQLCLCSETSVKTSKVWAWRVPAKC